MLKPFFGVSLATLCIISCFPLKNNNDSSFINTESEGTQTTNIAQTGTTGGGDGCGDGQATPNIYCYTLQEIPSIAVPQEAVAAKFSSPSQDDFAVFALGDQSPQAATVRWKEGAVEIGGGVPALALAAYDRVTAANIVGSGAPDLVWSNLVASGISPNEGAEFGSFVPSGLPDAVFLDDGHTMPIDLGQDGQSEFLKGTGDSVSLFVKAGDTWQQQMDQFSVPGCNAVIDFAHGDFNGDGLGDIAYIGQYDTDSNPETCQDLALHGIVVLLQTELGQLQEINLVSTGMHKFQRVFTGDLDGDQNHDLVTIATTGEVVVFRSLQSSFDTPVSVDKALALAVGNVDGDAVDELILFTKEDRVVKFVDNVLSEPSVSIFPDFAGVPLATGDLNGDGVDEIVFRQAGDKAPSLVIALANP